MQQNLTAVEKVNYNYPRFITLEEIPDIMSIMGINRGFSRASLNRKIADGTFNVPCIKEGNCRYFKAKDIIAYLDNKPLVSPKIKKGEK